MIDADTALEKSAIFLLHNNYYSYTNQYNFEWGKKKFTSLQAGFKENPAQEKLQGKSLWINLNPLFKDQKYLTDLSAKNSGEYFRNGLVLLPGSALKRRPFDLDKHFNILSNTKDYCNNELSPDGNVLPGACTR